MNLDDLKKGNKIRFKFLETDINGYKNLYSIEGIIEIVGKTHQTYYSDNFFIKLMTGNRVYFLHDIVENSIVTEKRQ